MCSKGKRLFFVGFLYFVFSWYISKDCWQKNVKATWYRNLINHLSHLVSIQWLFRVAVFSVSEGTLGGVWTFGAKGSEALKQGGSLIWEKTDPPEHYQRQQSIKMLFSERQRFLHMFKQLLWFTFVSGTKNTSFIMTVILILTKLKVLCLEN